MSGSDEIPVPEQSAGYRLLWSEVPGYPDTRQAADLLRWTIAVMDPGDKDLANVANLLAAVINNDGLSRAGKAQAKRIVDRIWEQWRREDLRFQQIEDRAETASRAPDLSAMKPAGRA